MLSEDKQKCDQLLEKAFRENIMNRATVCNMIDPRNLSSPVGAGSSAGMNA